MKINKYIIIGLLLIGMLSSCVVAKSYEMVNLNDPDVALKDKGCDRFLTNFQAYREAASGANGGSTGGGCGCN